MREGARAVVQPYTGDDMSTQPTSAGQAGEHLELPVDEVLRRAKPYPPREELVIEDLTDDQEDAFWEAITA